MTITNILETAQVALHDAMLLESRTGKAIDSMERRYWEGYIDALQDLAEINV